MSSSSQSKKIESITDDLTGLKLRLKIIESEIAYIKYKERYYQKAHPEVKTKTPKPEVTEELRVKEVSELERAPLQDNVRGDTKEKIHTSVSTKAKAVPRIHVCGVCGKKGSFSVAKCTKCDHYVCPKCVGELRKATEESTSESILCIRCRIVRWKNCPCFKEFAIQCHGKRCTSYGCKKCFLAYHKGGNFCPSCWGYEMHRKPVPRPRPVSDTPETKSSLEGWDGN